MSRILIVEDEISIAELEKDYLELSDYEVDIASDGETGESMALKGDYVLCILDVMLPGKDGFEICKAIRKEKNIPIIMVSAKRDDIDKIRGLGLGADDYITKPFDMEEVLARIESNLRRVQFENRSAACLQYGDLCLALDGNVGASVQDNNLKIILEL